METNDRTLFVNFERGDKDLQLEKLYAQLGKAYYEGGFEDPLPQLLPLFDQITALKNCMERGAERCPRCGEILEENAVYCGQCGYKVR